jgi:hypothetical protein
VCELLLEDAAPAMEARHLRADGDVEDLRGLGVRELADVDEHEHVAEVVRHLGERLDDRVLRKTLEHALLVRVLIGHRRLEAVVEVVVAFLERLQVGRALDAPATVDVQVREDAEQPRPQVGPRLELLPGAERACVRVLH